MNLQCVCCPAAFDAPTFRGYCPACLERHRQSRHAVHQHQNPTPDIHLDGKFTDEPCLTTIQDPVTGKHACPLCGSDELEPGYGMTGYGLGSYRFCLNCNHFLDFVEDPE